MVPHLVTALSGPIDDLEQRLLDSMPAIERWFRLEWMEHTPPFYSAVDIRNSGFKLSPVDLDFFPGAWSCLAPDMMPLAVQSAMAAIEKICPEARNLLLIPDHRLNNSFYLNSLDQLMRIFNMAGLNIRLGSIDPAIDKTQQFTLQNGRQLTVEPVQRTQHRLLLKDFDPCTILLNHDLSHGIPGIMEDLHEQYLLPPLHASWALRSRNRHYEAYDELSKRLSKLLNIDPWLINPMYTFCGELDLNQKVDCDILEGHVDALLQKIRRKYREYSIDEKPFIVIKANQGPQARGFLTLRDTKDLKNLHLSQHQENQTPYKGELILQEGIRTHERINDVVAEPVVHMIDRYVVGGYYRVHAQLRDDEGLAAPGSHFVPLAFASQAHLPQLGEAPGRHEPNRFYMYGVIARLAMLAGSYELENTDPQAETYE